MKIDGLDSKQMKKITMVAETVCVRDLEIACACYKNQARNRYAPIKIKAPERGGGGRADPGEFDILMGPKSNSPPPGTY